MVVIGKTKPHVELSTNIEVKNLGVNLSGFQAGMSSISLHDFERHAMLDLVHEVRVTKRMRRDGRHTKRDSVTFASLNRSIKPIAHRIFMNGSDRLITGAPCSGQKLRHLKYIKRIGQRNGTLCFLVFTRPPLTTLSLLESYHHLKLNWSESRPVPHSVGRQCFTV
jgi:hypothetical protein